MIKLNKTLLFILFILFSIVLFPSVLAIQNTVNICIDNSTLQTNVAQNVCIGNDCFQLIRTFNKTCNYGCDNTTFTCNPTPLEASVWVGIVLFLLFGLIGAIVWYSQK